MILGLVIILESQSLGIKRGERAIRRNGGYMETSQYNRVIEETAVNFRIIGIIIASVGGYGLVTFGNSLYQDHD